MCSGDHGKDTFSLAVHPVSIARGDVSKDTLNPEILSEIPFPLRSAVDAKGLDTYTELLFPSSLNNFEGYEGLVRSFVSEQLNVSDFDSRVSKYDEIVFAVRCGDGEWSANVSNNEIKRCQYWLR